MSEFVAYAVVTFALLAAVHAGWHLWRDAPFSNALFYVIAGLELVLLAVLVGGAFAFGDTTHEVDGVLYFSYLITMVVIPPAAVLWGIAEKSRWGTGVVVVAMLTVAILAVRCLGIWQGTYV